VVRTNIEIIPLKIVDYILEILLKFFSGIKNSKGKLVE